MATGVSTLDGLSAAGEAVNRHPSASGHACPVFVDETVIMPRPLLLGTLADILFHGIIAYLGCRAHFVASQNQFGIDRYSLVLVGRGRRRVRGGRDPPSGIPCHSCWPIRTTDSTGAVRVCGDINDVRLKRPTGRHSHAVISTRSCSRGRSFGPTLLGLHTSQTGMAHKIKKK